MIDSIIYLFAGTLAAATPLLFAAMGHIQNEANKISLPLFLLHGGKDLMAAPDSSRFLYENIGSKDKSLQIYPELYHEIFNEPERNEVFADLLDWCDRHLSLAGT